MKKILYILSICSLLLALSSCGGHRIPGGEITLPVIESASFQGSDVSSASGEESTTESRESDSETTPELTSEDGSSPTETTIEEPETTTEEAETTTEAATTETVPAPETESQTAAAETETAAPTSSEETPPETSLPPATEAPSPAASDTQPQPAGEGPLVCIDPGHQGQANHEQEPVSPGSDQTKDKVADGTYGITTGIRESVVNLTIALQLRDELLARGYRVLMTRTSEDVNISNIERAQLANNAGAEAFLRLHCDSGAADWTGCAIFCQHPHSEYNGFQYENSRRLSELLLTHMCSATGAINRGITEAYHYSGINWSKVPGGLIEMGFLSNASDEQKLLDPAYQQRLVQGMADGLDAYFGR